MRAEHSRLHLSDSFPNQWTRRCVFPVGGIDLFHIKRIVFVITRIGARRRMAETN